MTEKDYLNQHSTSGIQAGHDPSITRDLGVAGQPISAVGQDLAGQVQETVSNVGQQAGQAVGQIADQAKQQVSSQVEAQKQRASETLSSVAQAIRQTSTQLRTTEQAGIAEYANQAADQVERFSGFLRDTDVNGILNEAEQFARRQPALFLGGAFAIGLMAARFLKSSSQQRQQISGQQFPMQRYPQSYGYQQSRPLYPQGQGSNYNPMNRPQARSVPNQGMSSQFNQSGTRSTFGQGTQSSQGDSFNQGSQSRSTFGQGTQGSQGSPSTQGSQPYGSRHDQDQEER